MNNLEIDKLLFSNNVTENFYKGCFPCNKLPNLESRVFGVCINLSPSGDPGTHWIGVFVKANTAYYFDSSGAPPFVSEIKEWLKKFDRVIYNDVQHQQFNSKVCGGFVCYFIYEMSRSVPFYGIVNHFLKIKNDDEFIVRFMRSKFDYKLAKF